MKKLIGYLALFALLALAGTSLSQCKSRVIYAAPYVAPYVAPVYVERVVKVVKAVPVYVAPDYYYSVSDGFRDALLADAVAFRILSAQGRFGAGPAVAPAATAPLPRYPDRPEAAPPAALPTAPGVPPDGAPRTMPRADLGAPASAELARLVNGKCIRCHATAKNGLDLSDLSAVPLRQRRHAFALANAGEMPPGGTPIADAEVRLLFDWAQPARK